MFLILLVFLVTTNFIAWCMQRIANKHIKQGNSFWNLKPEFIQLITAVQKCTIAIISKADKTTKVAMKNLI